MNIVKEYLINNKIYWSYSLVPKFFTENISSTKQASKQNKTKQHKKNKGTRQWNASSRNSKAIDVWNVARHPPSRHVMACDDYSLKNIIVFFFLQRDVRTIIKLKLEQASKEYQKEFHRKKKTKKKKRERLAKMFFYVHIAISQSSRWFKAFLERFSRMKYCF